MTGGAFAAGRRKGKFRLRQRHQRRAGGENAQLRQKLSFTAVHIFPSRSNNETFVTSLFCM
jgi:hypothetical protein